MFSEDKNGYMTIETSMVFPVIVMGVVFVIYVGFYLYDVSVIKQVSYVAALRASQQTDLTSSEIKAFAKNQLNSLADKKLLVIEEKKEEIEVSGGKVKVFMSAKVKMPFSILLSEKLKLWEIKSEAEAVRVNPVKIIRSIRGSDDS